MNDKLYDSKSTNSGLAYNVLAIESAKVVSLESIAKLDTANLAKLETLSFSQIHLPMKYNVSQYEASRILACYHEACNIADKAIKQYLKDNPKFDENHGYWGFVHVTVRGYSKCIEVLRGNGKAASYSDGKYYLGQMSSYKTMNLDLLEVGARAAAHYLSDTLKEQFSVDIQFD